MLRSFLLAALSEKDSPPETDKDISESVPLYEDFVRIVLKEDNVSIPRDCPKSFLEIQLRAGLPSLLVSPASRCIR